MYLKPPTSIDEQIKKLREHGMIIEDEESATLFLSKVGYYRFTGYAIPYRISPKNSDFVPNTTFSQIKALYEFDEELRHLLRKYLELIEVYYRVCISNWFSLSHCRELPCDQHYDLSNYGNEKEINDFFKQLEKQESYYKDSLVVKHHKNKYMNKFPLWVIFEMISFSELSKYYSCLKDEDAELIAKANKIGHKDLQNHLHCLSVLRNKCAHASRLYNTNFAPPVAFTPRFLKRNPKIRNYSLFAYLLIVARHLVMINQKTNYINDILALIKKYNKTINFKLVGIPQNYITPFDEIVDD